jgi:hypothetical protein
MTQAQTTFCESALEQIKAQAGPLDGLWIVALTTAILTAVSSVVGACVGKLFHKDAVAQLEHHKRALRLHVAHAVNDTAGKPEGRAAGWDVTTDNWGGNRVRARQLVYDAILAQGRTLSEPEFSALMARP